MASSTKDKPKVDKITIEGAELIFRNFSGTPNQYNAEGKMDFCVKISPDLAERLEKEGWNVRYLPGRVEGQEPQAYLRVAVSYDKYPPIIFMIDPVGRQIPVTQAELKMLDWIDIAHADLQINPYSWTNPKGESGIKAYLRALYVRAEEDPLAKKYAQPETTTEDLPVGETVEE